MKPRERLKIENQLRHLDDAQLADLIDRDIRIERHHQREAARHSARANVAQAELRKRNARSTTESAHV
jgi:hypothetical protein